MAVFPRHDNPQPAVGKKSGFENEAVGRGLNHPVFRAPPDEIGSFGNALLFREGLAGHFGRFRQQAAFFPWRAGD